jgi:23S rRNA (adenine-N6)-dimethyltransferase
VAVRQRPTREAPGQHFLRSSRLAAELVGEAGIASGDHVVDIGAGTGALSAALLDAGAVVTAYETDPTLATVLRRRFAGRKVTVVEEDAHRARWPATAFSVVSNLPFAGSGAILGDLLRDPGMGLTHADVIVQWEFAEKHAAVWPTTLRSTYWRAWFHVGIAARLARTSFSPPPRVDAALLRIARRDRPLVPVEAHAAYRRFLEDAFRARAPLGRALRGRVTTRELRRLAPVLGFDAAAFPRDLDARQWAHVFAYAAAHGRGGRRRG